MKNKSRSHLGKPANREIPIVSDFYEGQRVLAWHAEHKKILLTHIIALLPHKQGCLVSFGQDDVTALVNFKDVSILNEPEMLFMDDHVIFLWNDGDWQQAMIVDEFQMDDAYVVKFRDLEVKCKVSPRKHAQLDEQWEAYITELIQMYRSEMQEKVKIRDEKIEAGTELHVLPPSADSNAAANQDITPVQSFTVQEGDLLAAQFPHSGHPLYTF
ncbi:unnamed protein product, partial [Didymodactylos carnosus]